MLIYNIPAASLSSYRDKVVSIRSNEGRKLTEAFSKMPRQQLWSLQVLSVDCDTDGLLHLSDSVPIELVVDDPATEAAGLYRFSEFIQKHPVRVTVKVAPGMTKAVKIAQALNFNVKLDIDQPNASQVDELLALAGYYVRGSTVGSSIEPFESLFLSFCREKPMSLWNLQEEDPKVDRYVSDDGTVALSKRLAALAIPENQFASFLEQSASVCRVDDECSGCDFFSRCQSFFKLPDKSYRCDHVKRIFVLLNEAAMELKHDEERYIELHGRDTRPASE